MLARYQKAEKIDFGVLGQGKGEGMRYASFGGVRENTSFTCAEEIGQES